MFRFFCFLFFFFNISIFASVHEMYLNAMQKNEPDSLFDGCVNVITGNFVFDDEIIADGKEQIKLKRSYFSLNNFDKRSKDQKSQNEYVLAGWSYHNVTKAFFYGDRIDIVQPPGVVYSFEIPCIKFKKKDKNQKDNLNLTLSYKSASYPPNFSNKKDVKLIDPKEIKVLLKGQYELFVYYPDGTYKFYKREKNNLNEYLLRSETLQNQNMILYFYDGLSRLKEIRSVNPSQSVIYAWVKFNYFNNDSKYSEKHKDKHDFVLITSDGENYEFKHNNFYPIINNKQKSVYPFFILESVNSNQFNEKMEYHLDYKKTHPLLKKIVLPNRAVKEVGYYLLGDKNPEMNVQFFDVNDFRFERVKTLSESTSNGTMHNTYKFYYDPPSSDRCGITTIYDAHSNKYVYFYNSDAKIEKIQRFENKNNQYFFLNEERFVWKKNEEISLLISKVFLDSTLQPIFAKRLFYDESNNLIEEKIYGNISGLSKKLILDDQNLPLEGSDVVCKKYKYNKARLIEETNSNKTTTQYFYLPETNIMSTKIVFYEGKVKKRNFYEYNQDLLLIKEIKDDSTSLNKNELVNCSYRKIKYFYPKTKAPFLGFTEVLEERYLDLKTLQEKLFKKEVYGYSPTGKVITKSIYDSDNKFAFSYVYEYDAKGNLIFQVDKTGKKTVYNYDSNNNKILESLPNGTTISNSYNIFSQLTKKEIKNDREVFKLSYFYDSNNNNTVFIDDFNNETKYEYDDFSNLTKEITDKLVDRKKTKIIKTYKYDEKGNKTFINHNQNMTKISYNIYCDPILIVHPDSTQESFVYNLDGTVKTFIDKENVQTHYEYDFLKRVINKKITSPKGDILEEESFKYNLYGLVEEKNKNQTTKYYYDFFTRPIKKEITSSNDTYVEEYFYDSLSRKYKTIFNDTYVEITKKDLLDRVVDIEKTDLNGSVFYKKSYRYDKFGNLNVISYLEDKEVIEKYCYDAFQRLIKKIDALGNETTYSYENCCDFSVNLLKTTTVNPLDQIEEKLSDKEGNIILFQKKNLNDQIFYKEENFYDFSNNLTSKKCFFKIDDHDQKNEFFYFYDNMNRLIKCVEKENDFDKETKYSYTKKGYVKTITKPDGIILEKDYDYLGNLIKLTSSDRSCEYFFEYNEQNLPIKIVDLNSNEALIRDYNDFGCLIEERFSNGLELKKKYDSLKRKTKVIYPDNSFVEYFYNPFYLHKVIRQNSFAQKTYNHEYINYDFSGNLLQEKLLENLGITNYKFDFLGRKILIDTPFGSEKVEKYDPIGRVEEISWKIFWGTNSLNYKYDNFNKVVKQTGLFENEEEKELSKISYDKNGNILFIEKQNQTISYTYDALNRLIQIINGDHVVEFSYDGLNRKVKKNTYKLEDENKILISAIKYLYDEYEEIGTYSDANKVLELKIFGIKENDKTKSIAYELEDKIYAPLYDIFGNVSSLISLNRGLVESYRYSYWGENLICSSSGRLRKSSAYANPWRYLDIRIDEDNNLLHFNTIFYDISEKKLLNPHPLNILEGSLSKMSVLPMQKDMNLEKK